MRSHQIVCFLMLCTANFGLCETWGKGLHCPLTCTCQLQHLTETPIFRFIQKDRSEVQNEASSVEYNDVLNMDNIEPELFEEKPIVRTATCILQGDTEPLELLQNLSPDLDGLTLIQGYNTGSKAVKFSDFHNFTNLLSLEMLGPNSLHKLTDSRLVCELDQGLKNLKYLNLENIAIKNSITQIQKFVKEFTDKVETFEYVQKLDSNVHPLTMVQQGINDEVLPYNKYKEQFNVHKVPLFIGFKQLFLLRVSKCELNNIHWSMFDGLQNLEYLILEKNNLKFIPPFAFYGTPNLKSLSLAHNSLLDIQIMDLAGLLELEYLDLSYNNFSQLSELSLPPFPKLKLADFRNNPITVIFPNTFEVMNTTDSLIIGSDDVSVSLMTNSFLGLNLLKSLTLNNLNIKLLKRDYFVGMPSLTELILTGNITEIEYDTFLEIYKLQRLILSNCMLKNISMDAFIGLGSLETLDLSKNDLEYLPPGVFDQLINIKELYLNNNKFKELPRDIFSRIHAKLIRLNDNPWHCSCDMSEWKPMIVNRIKQKIAKQCDMTHDKNVGCNDNNQYTYKYIYENKVAPKCFEPKQYNNWSVFHAMRRLLKCPEYKPKIRKYHLKKYDNKTANILGKSTVGVEQNLVNLKQIHLATNLATNKSVRSLGPSKTSNFVKQDLLNNKLGNSYETNQFTSTNEENDFNNNLNALNPFDYKIPKNNSGVVPKKYANHKYVKKIKKHRKPE